MGDHTTGVLYAFGDSIIAGHTYPQRSCVDIAAERAGLRLVKLARNGAAILPRPLTRPDLGGQIIDQCDEVPADAPAPDVIIFDGGTNDAWLGGIMDRLGEVVGGAPGKGEPVDDGAPAGGVSGGMRPSAEPESAAFDRATFAGCFEATIAEYRRRWPDARLVYLAVAKMGARPMDYQLALRRIELAACAKWGVTVADVFGDTDLDTRRDADRIAYSFDQNGRDGLPGTPETITYPDPATQPSGTHPNFPAVERFYVPVILQALGA